MADESTTTVKETTLHPDDSVLVSALSVAWSGTEDSEPLLRMEKEVLTDAEPRTQYTYGQSSTDTRKVFLSVPHGDPPVEVAVDDNGQRKTLKLQDKQVHTGLQRPQIWYTYGLEGSGPTVRILRYL